MVETTENTQDANQPDYRSAMHRLMMPYINYVRDVEKGTLHLRNKGTVYLPREEAETDKAYAIRLSRALLVNFYARAKNALVGLVFQDVPQLTADVPVIMRGQEKTDAQPAIDDHPAIEAQAAIEGQLEDCDLLGTHWTVFFKQVFQDALGDGHSFVLTDMPPALPDGSTKEDEVRANRRPYFVKYKADQALNWRFDRRGRLEQVTFEELSVEAEGLYGEQMACRYRVLRPGNWELYKKVNVNGKEIIVPDPDTPNGKTSLTEIPLSVCYGKYVCPMVSVPSLLDLAVVNVTHYAEGSDIAIYRHLCSRPAWWARNRTNQGKDQVLSPYTFIDVGPEGEVGVAESSGASLGEARTALKDLEEYMGMLALQMLTEQTPQKTATEERGDQIVELSELATAAQSLKDCMESAFGFWAQYLKLPSGGSVALGVKSEQLIGEGAARVFLDAAGVVFTKATVRKILAKAYTAFMPEDYSEAVEKVELEDEAAKAAENAPDFGRAFNAGAGL